MLSSYINYVIFEHSFTKFTMMKGHAVTLFLCFNSIAFTYENPLHQKNGTTVPDAFHKVLLTLGMTESSINWEIAFARLAERHVAEKELRQEGILLKNEHHQEKVRLKDKKQKEIQRRNEQHQEEIQRKNEQDQKEIQCRNEQHQEEIQRRNEQHQEEIQRRNEQHQEEIQRKNEQHQKEIQRRNEQHQEEIQRKNEQHQEEIQRKNEQHQKEIQRKDEQHQEEIQRKNEQHQEEIQRKNEQYQKEIQRKNEQHQKEIPRRNEQHQKVIERINEQHQEEIERINENHQEEIQRKNEQCRKEVELRESIFRNMFILRYVSDHMESFSRMMNDTIHKKTGSSSLITLKTDDISPRDIPYLFEGSYKVVFKRTYVEWYKILMNSNDIRVTSFIEAAKNLTGWECIPTERDLARSLAFIYCSTWYYTSRSFVSFKMDETIFKNGKQVRDEFMPYVDSGFYADLLGVFFEMTKFRNFTVAETVITTLRTTNFDHGRVTTLSKLK